MSMHSELEGEVVYLTEENLLKGIQSKDNDYQSTYYDLIRHIPNKTEFSNGKGDIASVRTYLSKVVQEFGLDPTIVNKVSLVFTTTLLGGDMYSVGLTTLYATNQSEITEYIAIKGAYIYDGVEQQYLLLTLKNTQSNEVLFRGYIRMFM